MMMGQASARLELGVFVMEPFGLRAEATPFELSLIIEESGHQLAGCLQYNADLFDAPTIEHLAASYRHVLEAIAADPDQHIADIPIVPQNERDKLLGGFNATEAEQPGDICCHEMIASQARRTPDAVALIFDDQHMTYRELDERSNQLAHYLRSLGVGPDTLVGICIERSCDMVVGLLAILKAGAAYLPLDPALPRERLRFMLQDSGTPLLITQHSLVAGLPPFAGKIVCLDARHDAVSQQPEDCPSPSARPIDLAYVIYTSGSTGQPKGVQVPHGALVNFLRSMAREPRAVAGRRPAQRDDVVIRHLCPGTLPAAGDGGVRGIGRAMWRPIRLLYGGSSIDPRPP